MVSGHKTRRVNRFHAGRPTAAAFLLVLCWTLSPQQAAAGGADLPDAATILDKYVEVTGGEAAYAKVHNCFLKKHVVQVGMGFEDALTEYRAMPNKIATVITSEAMGTIKSGTDGNVSYYVCEQAGPMIDDGEARAANLEAAAFDRVDQWRKYYKKVECVSEETVDGKPCYKVVLTPNNGPTETRFYDKETNLVVAATKTRLSSHMPTLEARLTFDDYKWVDGILLPHKMTQEFDMCGGKRSMVFVTDSVKFNVDWATDPFKLPVEVVAAMKDGSSKVAGKPAPCSRSGKPAPCGRSGKIDAGKAHED